MAAPDRAGRAAAGDDSEDSGDDPTESAATDDEEGASEIDGGADDGGDSTDGGVDEGEDSTDGGVDEGEDSTDEDAEGTDSVPEVSLTLYQLTVSVTGQETDDLREVEDSATRLMDYLVEKTGDLEDRPDDRGLG